MQENAGDDGYWTGGTQGQREGSKTGGIQDRRDTGHGEMQERDAGQYVCKTGGMLGMRDARQVGCRTGGMQGMWDAGQEGCRTGGMQDRKDAKQVGCRTGGTGMQGRWDAGKLDVLSVHPPPKHTRLFLSHKSLSCWGKCP